MWDDLRKDNLREVRKYNKIQKLFWLVMPLLHVYLLSILYPIILPLTTLHILELFIKEGDAKTKMNPNLLKVCVVAVSLRKKFYKFSAKWSMKLCRSLVHEVPEFSTKNTYVQEVSKEIWLKNRREIEIRVSDQIREARARRRFGSLVYFIDILVRLCLRFPWKLGTQLYNKRSSWLTYCFILLIISLLSTYQTKTLLITLLYYRLYLVRWDLYDATPPVPETLYKTFPIEEVNWLKHSSFEYDKENAYSFAGPIYLHSLGKYYGMYYDENKKLELEFVFEGKLIKYKRTRLWGIVFCRNYISFIELLLPKTPK